MSTQLTRRQFLQWTGTSVAGLALAAGLATAGAALRAGTGAGFFALAAGFAAVFLPGIQCSSPPRGGLRGTRDYTGRSAAVQRSPGRGASQGSDTVGSGVQPVLRCVTTTVV